ncbi:threonine synthase [Dactylosporangium darangshiense]|uniref:Threonine synthase n=1 Tax=Dactylosporangium darangshiense TaxID=579108 RepID=A0ABP8DCZ3_9ACTN
MLAEGLRCLRCDARYEPGAMFAGCPACAGRGTPSNLSVVYDDDALAKAVHDRPREPGSLWRYRDLLPVAPQDVTTLGEGGTPLVPAPRLAAKLGLKELYLKDESRNPTGSFKDRLAAVAVSVARGMGMRVITGSSSGNAGAATAAFAARAGLPCVMLTTQQFPIAMKTQMAVFGTLLLAAPTVKDRWRIVGQAVERLDWFPVTVYTWPYFGSNCYGIEGYKTIGYEIVDQLGRAPDHVVVPVGAGDAFTGAWKGFCEFRRAGVIDTVPRMHAAEVYGPLEHALAEGLDDCIEMPIGPDPTVAVSVGSNLSTFQALNVLRDTGGAARSADNAAMLQAQRDLAALEGIYVETSSALSVATIPRLVETGAVDPAGTVVAVLTSTGLKHSELTAAHLPSIPECGADLDSALDVLHSSYGFTAP